VPFFAPVCVDKNNQAALVARMMKRNLIRKWRAEALIKKSE
tara:strand:- start:687 stop:809 length:123 start_codon:yes stop_codon:yes gene_type:complete